MGSVEGKEGECCSEYVGAHVVWQTSQLTHNQLSPAISPADPRKTMRDLYIYYFFSLCPSIAIDIGSVPLDRVYVN